MSVGKRDILRTIGSNPEISSEQIYSYKDKKIQDISEIIALSGVKLSGLSYWSLTDKTDCNLERIRTELQKVGKITEITEINNALVVYIRQILN